MTILQECRLTHTQAARKLGVNPSTTWRWSLNGVRGVKLETFSVGVQRFTTKETLKRFVAATTAVAASGPMPSVRTPLQRERAIIWDCPAGRQPNQAHRSSQPQRT